MNLSFIKYLPLIATFAKGFMNNAKQDYKVKNFDKTKEKIDTIEHMLVKVEKKIGECRNEIEDLRRQVMFSRTINLVLSILIIFLILFLR